MSASKPTLGRPPSGVRPRGPLVLVVDGDEAVRALYATELAASGFMVLDAHDGASGVEKATQFGPHAIVLDLVLPGCDGFKVARRLREIESTRDVAIVAISSLRSERTEPMALAAGCDAFFSKPVMGATLVATLIRLLARRAGQGTAPDMSRIVKGQ
jgi:DNA-binding response OmpR family regulator